jgi:hypothetical protein
MHKISKEKNYYTIITWKEFHQYPLDELTTHGVAENRLCRKEIHPKKLLELCCTFL